MARHPRRRRNRRASRRHPPPPPPNLYRWEARLNERGLRGLEPDSRRPRNSRKPQRDPALVKAVLAIRKKPPCYGKDKIAVVLRKRGWGVSASMAGRILSDAKRRGTLREPPRPGVARRNPKPKRPYAVRKPKDYRPARPGDLVQVDTLDVRPLPGVILKHFTARDVVSRCDVLQVGTQATSASAARFLDAIVARAHQTRVEEFSNYYDGELTMGQLNRALREWEARSSTRIGVSRLAGGLRWSILRSGAWRRPPNPLLSHMRRTSTLSSRLPKEPPNNGAPPI